MDPISHAVVGQTLGMALRKRSLSRRSTVLLAVVGALAPDVDAVLMPFGWDRYLRAHEIGTHSLIGALVVAAAIVAVVRPRVRRHTLVEIFGVVWLACISHIALDVLSGARIQIGWPLVAGRASVPLVAMADPWLMGILILGGVVLGRAKRHPRRMAAAVLTGVAAFLALKATLLIRAERPAADVVGGPVLARVVEAEWASLTRWRLLERRAGVLVEWRIATGRPPRLVLSQPVVPDTARVRESRALDTVKNFLHVHELGFAVELPADDGGFEVLWSDLRFCRPSGGGTGAVASLATGQGRSRMACGLWFGGTFDRSGRAITQLVKIGEWRQTRAPRR